MHLLFTKIDFENLVNELSELTSLYNTLIKMVSKLTEQKSVFDYFYVQVASMEFITNNLGKT